MTWTDFRNHVVSQFLDADDRSEQARDAVRRVRAAAMPGSKATTPRALLAHPFFLPLDAEELAAAMDSYSRLFLAGGDEEYDETLPYPEKPGRRGGRTLAE